MNECIQVMLNMLCRFVHSYIPRNAMMMFELSEMVKLAFVSIFVFRRLQSFDESAVANKLASLCLFPLLN